MQKVDDTSADIFIQGDIVSEQWDESDTSAKSFRDGLKELGNVPQLNVHINSAGGSVFDGIAIENMLKQSSSQVNVYIDGLAASIASVIAMGGDTIFMPSNAMMMIHMPWTITMGNAKDMRKSADDLEKIAESSIITYLDKAGDKLDRNTLVQLMNNETWLTADEAVEYGLADEVLEPVTVAASLDSEFLQKYSHVPTSLLQKDDKKPTDDDDNSDVKKSDTDSDDDPKKKNKDKSKTDDSKSDDDDETDDDKKKQQKLEERSKKIALQLKEIYNYD